MQTEQLSDLDELVLRCRSDGAKGYMREAVLAYKSGAFRASIVATWTALVFDLIDKIREMSIAGSPAAAKWLKNYEDSLELFEGGDKTAVNSLLRFEKGILDDARDEFSFISQYNYLDLERLRDDRNRCAHPTFQRIEVPYYPTAEQARYHIKNSVVHVLSQPPVQGKYALANLKKLVDSKYFPDDLSDAIKQLEGSDLLNPTESLVNAFVDYLLFSMVNDAHELHNQRRAAVALNASLYMHHENVLNRVAKTLSKIIMNTDNDNLRVCINTVGYINEVFDIISEQAKIKLKEFSDRCDTEIFIDILKHLIKFEYFNSIAKQRVDTLTYGLVSRIHNWDSMEICIERAVNLFCLSKNWNEANSIYETLIVPILSKLENEHFEKFLRSATSDGCDLKGSVGFADFLRYLIEKEVYTISSLREKLEEYSLWDYYSQFDFMQQSQDDV